MLAIQRDADGSFRTNRLAHTADLVCNVCGTEATGVDMNANGKYSPLHGTPIAIALACADIGGSCDSVTFWPLTNGTGDAQEMSLVKTA